MKVNAATVWCECSWSSTTAMLPFLVTELLYIGGECELLVCVKTSIVDAWQDQEHAVITSSVSPLDVHCLRCMSAVKPVRAPAKRICVVAIANINLHVPMTP